MACFPFFRWPCFGIFFSFSTRHRLMRTPLRLIKLSACIWSTFSCLYYWVKKSSRPFLPIGWKKLQIICQLFRWQTNPTLLGIVRHQQQVHMRLVMVAKIGYTKAINVLEVFTASSVADLDLDPGSGIRCLFDPWTRIQDPESGIQDPKPIFFIAYWQIFG